MPAARSPHVLAIDDEPELRTLYADLLEDAGYVVTLAARPLPIAEVKRLRPDLIVLDLIIDGEPDGWTYLDDLGADLDTRAIPVVLCSAAMSQVEARSAALEQANVDVVLKPFDIDILTETISRRLPED